MSYVRTDEAIKNEQEGIKKWYNSIGFAQRVKSVSTIDWITTDDIKKIDGHWLVTYTNGDIEKMTQEQAQPILDIIDAENERRFRKFINGKA